MSININIDELERLALAATPGPWYCAGTEIDPMNVDAAVARCRKQIESTVFRISHFMEVQQSESGKTTAIVGNGCMGYDNAEFIAAANPAAILALIAIVREKFADAVVEQFHHPDAEADALDTAGDHEEETHS